ncbi:carotenoid 9,10(9',10')-cleavage dioxygenase-like isoform X2 [Camellia sinensis]|uniref:carotenoid 9,10(9',10')-cleavage dioxygenase-like isoform X2 n=1 Tax=Camellia sinensis TaxID=4442 RepID=UPI00103674E1|nr:carotenoid 9,10(9',10')-cleavage dioxygenase-like isoform X2 [Camellia sinensis]
MVKKSNTTDGRRAARGRGRGERETYHTEVDWNKVSDWFVESEEMVKENKLIFTFDATKKACFGVLPRYAKDELLIKWFELPNCFIFHNANAWEEGDEVVLITCRLENPDLDMVNGPVKEKLENFGNELYEMRFNMKTGLASQRKLSAPAVDFPRVNESYTGRKQRFVYATTLDSIAKVTGIIKFDLHAEPESGKTKLEVGGNIQGIFDLGPHRFGSEAIFVPRDPGVTSEEDDGYLIFFVHDEVTGKSAVNVIDAKSMSADPVAVVELPHRVPYGFHALFVTEVSKRDVKFKVASVSSLMKPFWKVPPFWTREESSFVYPSFICFVSLDILELVWMMLCKEFNFVILYIRCTEFKGFSIYDFGMYALLNGLFLYYTIASAKPHSYIMIDFVIEAEGNLGLLASYGLNL